MNCNEYRQALTENPAFAGGVEHAAVCPDCQAFTRKVQALNLDIARAMQIEVPPLKLPDLPDVDTGNVSALPARRRSHAPWWFAIAATVVLASSIALRMSGFFVTYDSLAEEVLAHLDHEPAALRVTDAPVPDQRLQRVVPADYAVFDREVSLITYANPCKINGKPVPHLVIQGQYGPVTILLMPEETLAEVVPIEGENVHGMILPVGDGSIAIIGSRQEPLEPIRQNVIQSVTWTT
jgi:hypothetical protein